MTPASDIEAAAALWMVRMDSDPPAAAQAQFREWLAADARHHAAFLRLQSVWKYADRLKVLRPLDAKIDENVLDAFDRPPPIEAPVGKYRFWAVIAVIVACAIGVTTWIVMVQSQWQVYATDQGGFQRVSLRDGSTALLNTDSEIRVRLTSKERHIVLSRGEALFTVAHDTGRPFDVEAADTRIRAVGTEFALRLKTSERVDVIVTEGRVAIDPPDRSADIELPRSTPLRRVSTVAAGETVSVKEHQFRIEKINGGDIARKLAWTRGQIVFDRATLAEAVIEFNRYNHRQLVVADPGIAGFQIGGAFDVTDLNSFIAALQKFGIRAFPIAGGSDDPDYALIELLGSGLGPASSGPAGPDR